MSTTEKSRSSNKKYWSIGAAAIAVAMGAYGFARLYPPSGPAQGTIAPASRYLEPQVGERDVTLGDTSVAKLMQSDAFEAMVKNPNFRALAHDPNFRALAQDPNFASVVKNPSFAAALKRGAVAKAISGTDANVAAQGIRLPNGRSAFGHRVQSLFGSNKVTNLELPRHG